MDKSRTLQSRIFELRQTFIAQLPERLAKGAEWIDHLGLHPEDQGIKEELHRLLHNIKGTGSSFRMPKLHELAKEGEQLLAPFLESNTSPGKPQQEALQAILRRIAQCAMALGEVAAPTDSPMPPFQLDPASPPPGDAMQNSPKLVFLCDDDTSFSSNLALQLNCFGYETKSFETLEALRMELERRRPDAIILDIIFPEGHSAGTDMLHELRQASPSSPPVIFLSARQDFEARLQAVKAGGDAFFSKPFKATDLAEALDSLTQETLPAPFRILVVDDDSELAAYHSLILENVGMTTATLQDLSKIFEVLHEFNADLVLMDMYMPQCNGHELARVIRQIPDYLSLPIIYLSGETDSCKQFLAMRVGAEGFLTKPIQPDHLVSEVTIRAERMRVLRSLMVRDSLTGLYNHTSIKQFLNNAMVRAKRTMEPLCFAMIDVDRFKQVNDTYGHPVGDQVLMALSRLLQKRLRNSDLVGRYGGEEFAVVMPDATLEQGTAILDQLREDFARVRFFSNNQEFSVTFSCGVGCFPHFDSTERLCEMADQSLYMAKRNGRNQVVANSSETAP